MLSFFYLFQLLISYHTFSKKLLSLPCKNIHICNIISYSLNSGTVLYLFKQAIITPIHKKPSLDPESFLNFRTISQLPLVSKMLERVDSRQLISYLTANNLHIPQ